MSENEALETAAIYSLTLHTRTLPGWHIRPFRSPHHTCSAVALVGGGSHPRPGEISRAAQQVEYPARFQLVAAMNPCPCGHLGDPGAHCHCSAEKIQRYRQRISGPLLDRIDMHIEVPAAPITVFTNRDAVTEEDSATVRSRVVRA